MLTCISANERYSCSHNREIDDVPSCNGTLIAPFWISVVNLDKELNYVIKMDMIKLDTKQAWINPTLLLGRRMECHKNNFLHVLFATCPNYMGTLLTKYI